MVKGVECIGTELKPDGLADPEVPLHGEINVRSAGSVENAARRITIGVRVRWNERCRIKPTPLSGMRKSSRASPVWPARRSVINTCGERHSKWISGGYGYNAVYLPSAGKPRSHAVLQE